MNYLMGAITGLGVLIGLVEMVAPKTAIQIRTRLTANDTGYRAEVRDWFDSTFHTSTDDPRATRSVRVIGLFVLGSSLFWGWVWFFTDFFKSVR